jgi:hypothetical protein
MIPDPTQPLTPIASTPATPATSSTSTSKLTAPHVLLGVVLICIVIAIAVLAGLHDAVPVVLQGLGVADAGALGVAVPAGSSS